MVGVLMSFLVGLAVGAWFGRREGRKEGAAAAAAGAEAPTPGMPPPRAAGEPATPGPPPVLAPPVVDVTASLLGPQPVTPNKRALKKGLTPDDFVPKDDILLQMQEAWERGEQLDPAVPKPVETDLEADERVRRVLARLEGEDPGQGPATMPEEPAPLSAPTAGTLTEGTVELTALGYGDDLRFEDGQLSCRQCEQTHPATEAEVDQVRRYEGQSDPGDEAILLGLRCPHCGAKGSIVSTYGPDADPALAEAFVYLASKAEHS